MVAPLFFGYCLCTACHSSFALPLGAIGGLCAVIVALAGHIIYYFSMINLGLARDVNKGSKLRKLLELSLS